VKSLKKLLLVVLAIFIALAIHSVWILTIQLLNEYLKSENMFELRLVVELLYKVNAFFFASVLLILLGIFFGNGKIKKYGVGFVATYFSIVIISYCASWIFKPPSGPSNVEHLLKLSEQVNQTLPQMLDSETRIMATSVKNGVFVIQYVLVNKSVQ
jgi:hypothetical protein